MFPLPSTAGKFVLYLSRERRHKPKKKCLKKGRNFGVITPNLNPNMACATDSVEPKIHSGMGMEFRWRMRYRTEIRKHLLLM